MNILSIDDAIQELAFDETDHAQSRQRKQAFRMLDTGIVAYVSTEYDDSVVEGARLDLAEEIVLSAVAVGKLQLLGRNARARPKDSVAMEPVELASISVEIVRAGTFDRIDGELVLWSGDEGESELVDLHLFEEEFAEFTRPLMAYRRLQSCTAYGMASYENNEAKPTDSQLPTVAAETECARWFEERAAQGNGHSFGGKRAMMNEAVVRFPRLSRRGFARVWHQCAPAEWKHPGRKPSRKAD